MFALGVMICLRVISFLAWLGSFYFTGSSLYRIYRGNSFVKTYDPIFAWMFFMGITAILFNLATFMFATSLMAMGNQEIFVKCVPHTLMIVLALCVPFLVQTYEHR